MRYALAAAFIIGVTAYAHAQQTISEAELQVIRAQRNSAMDQWAAAESRAQTLNAQNVQLKSEVEELKKKLPAEEKKAP